MARENSIAQDLYDLLSTRNFEPEISDEQGQPAQPGEGSVFTFDWISSEGQNYGTAVIVIGDDNELSLFFGDNLGKSMEEPDKSEWFDFMQQLAQFSTRHNFHTFSPKNLNQLKHTMAGMAAIKEGLFEGYYGTRQVSYTGEPTEARLMIRHDRRLAETDARYRHIDSIFIETADGERFKLPSRNMSCARAMLEHVRQGGRPYDVRGVHITEMANEIQTLSRFRRASAHRVMEGVTQDLVEQATQYYQDLRHTIKHLSTPSGYRSYFESWDPAQQTDAEALVEDIKTLFIEQRLDARIEAALPVLAKIQQRNIMKEADIFESWANQITEGTWALPDSPGALKQLQDLMGTELILGPDATNATQQLYDLVGDDQLFDILGQAAQQDPDANAWDIPGVQARLGELGIDIPTNQTNTQTEPADDTDDTDATPAASDLSLEEQDPMDQRSGVWDSFYEARESNAMAQAVTRRIMNQHPEWITRYGIEALLQVIDDVTTGEEDWEEIGSSDVSAYVNMVGDRLQDWAGSREEMRDRRPFAESDHTRTNSAAINIQKNMAEDQDPLTRLKNLALTKTR
jgi:hypothetical protein